MTIPLSPRVRYNQRIRVQEIRNAALSDRTKLRRAARGHEEADDAIKLINDDVGVSWLFSFLSADKKKTYCLYEAPSADLVREAARRANLPADVVIAVSEIRPGISRNVYSSTSALRRANAAASVRLAAFVLVSMLRTWFATVFGLTNSPRRSRGFPCPPQ